jgi:hypothetical protein
MVQEMVTGSVAVFTNPSGQTFERHERDSLGWALMDAARARVINGLLLAIIFPVRMSVLEAHRTAQGVSPDVIETTIAQPSNPISHHWGRVWFLDRFIRRLGGCPSSVERSVALVALVHEPGIFHSSRHRYRFLNVLALSSPCIGWVASLGLVFYGMSLTYLAIQSGMNLPSQKALFRSIIHPAGHWSSLLVFHRWYGSPRNLGRRLYPITGTRHWWDRIPRYRLEERRSRRIGDVCFLLRPPSFLMKTSNDWEPCNDAEHIVTSPTDTPIVGSGERSQMYPHGRAQRYLRSNQPPDTHDHRLILPVLRGVY